MAEGGGLLNRYTVKSCIGGSNPPLSARFSATPIAYHFAVADKGVSIAGSVLVAGIVSNEGVVAGRGVLCGRQFEL